MENFAVGETIDSAGYSVRITVNGICFYDFEDQYVNHLQRAYVHSSHDTIFYDISNILERPREKLLSLSNDKVEP